MEQIELNGSLVCYDDYNLEKKQDLINFLKGDYIKEIINSFEEKTIIVLGGDGTMLRAIKENYKKDMPFLGINFGHKGFLLNSKDFVKTNISYIKRNYPLLEVEIEIDGTIKKSIAVNEIDLRAGNGKMISLNISLSKKQVINIEGDGIIISTPAGSTGYNSSLGGPIIPHSLDAFVITPKAPWKPKGQASILINDTENIGISNVGRRLFTEIYCDGKEFLKTQDGLKTDIIVKKSNNKIVLLIAKDYLDFWDSKVLQEQGFNI